MKSSRHLKILDIIAKKDIDTQEELADELRKSGFDVTQATVSRDIKNLKLLKVQYRAGKYRYEAPKEEDTSLNDKLKAVLRNLSLSVENIDKMVIVKTVSGGAAAVAEAIDGFPNNEMAGTIAGDNTIFIMVRSLEAAEDLVCHIKEFIS